MATAKAAFYIDKVQLLPYHIHVEQRSDWHHRFEVTVSTEKAKVMQEASASQGDIMDGAFDYIGKTAEISINRPVGTFEFSGYITNVRVDQVYAGDAFIVFSGYSPTYLLDGLPVLNSFEDKNLKDIFQNALGALPANIKKQVAPKYTQPIPYIVQYRETNYAFLQRLAAIYGEWFYYDGQKIVFGKLPHENAKVDLRLGSDSMLSFNYGMNLRPTNFAHKYYKYEDHDTLKQSVSNYEPGWLDAHSRKALKASNKLFEKEHFDLVDHAVEHQGHLKSIAQAEKGSVLSNLMVFNGQSADPGVIVGAEVKVSSQNGLIGEYRVISVSHTVDGHQDYANTFEAIPLKSEVPPLNGGVIMPHAASQIAEVMDNDDPERLGRVRVQCKWQEEGMTPWIRVLADHAGEGRGHYFIPEIGDEALIDFEHGNPDRPYVVGSKYHAKIAPEFSGPNNDLKAIKTRSGHTLLFNDEDGSESITISDKNGNKINLDTNGKSISISSNSSISISSDDITISARNNIKINAKNDISLSGKNVKIDAKDDISLSSNNVKIDAQMETKISSGTKASITGNTELELKGSVQVKVQGGMVDVKGGLIKLN